MNDTFNLISVLRSRPQAVAAVSGSAEHPAIHGIVCFYQTRSGVVVYADIKGLPRTASQIYGFHIHSGFSCTGDIDGPFSDAKTHYDQDGREHPCHAGDMPPLFGNDGHAAAVFLTDRFSVSEIISRVVIIHDRPDDLTTQPSGNSGTKIACGVIKRSCTR